MILDKKEISTIIFCIAGLLSIYLFFAFPKEGQAIFGYITTDLIKGLSEKLMLLLQVVKPVF